MKIVKKIINKLCEKPYKATPGTMPPSWSPYKDYISIDPTALIAPSATVQFFNLPNPPKTMLRIGSMSHIFGHFSLLKADASIRVGDRCQIGSSHIISSKDITIGNDVLMAWGITLIDTDTHSTQWEYRKEDAINSYKDYLRIPSNFITTKKWENVSSSPIKIGDKSWIGFNSIVLKGVNLGPETIVGAGAVVTRSYDGKCTLAGNPAKKINE